MIDTHCHLDFPELRGRDILGAGRAAGVTGMITISTTTRGAPEGLEIARSSDRIWCSAGVHPLYADEGPHEWAMLEHVAADPRCVAWGELGLDNHYTEPSHAVQRAVLDEQLAFIRGVEERCGAGGRRLPIVLHCREAFDDLIPVLLATGLDPGRFVFHCFTAGPREMGLVLDFGAMVSFTGVVTYRGATDVQAAARRAPLDGIMVETDAPFLSPEPRRGVRPCEPWMASLTARRLADLRGEAWEEFHAAINNNTRRFFGIDAR